MVYKIYYKSSVEKDLERLDKSEQLRIVKKIESQLRNNPLLCPMLHGRLAGLRKLRVGDYRVIYSVMDDHVWVLRIANRKDVYR
ncbi:MAG: type II toxin-antitoxin system RelE/ParE family toxin [Deltaproteobacteria bacterium]|nr:type II toxin-antitoxin system RelE/ParE family toxin [Deltaproteobacteria bacterium]